MAQSGAGGNSGVGIYDRDYYREERASTPSYAPRTVVGAIIAVNVIVWLVDFLTPENRRRPMA